MNHSKKVLAFMLACTMAVGAMTGCTKEEATKDESTANTPATNGEVQSEAPKEPAGEVTASIILTKTSSP